MSVCVIGGGGGGGREAEGVEWGGGGRGEGGCNEKQSQRTQAPKGKSHRTTLGRVTGDQQPASDNVRRRTHAPTPSAARTMGCMRLHGTVPQPCRRATGCRARDQRAAWPRAGRRQHPAERQHSESRLYGPRRRTQQRSEDSNKGGGKGRVRGDHRAQKQVPQGTHVVSDRAANVLHDIISPRK
jgi:hypothetical protein